MPHHIHSDYAALEIGRELWVVRADPEDENPKFRGPFRSSAEVTAWLNDQAVRHRVLMEISRPAFSAWERAPARRGASSDVQSRPVTLRCYEVINYERAMTSTVGLLSILWNSALGRALLITKWWTVCSSVRRFESLRFTSR